MSKTKKPWEDYLRRIFCECGCDTYLSISMIDEEKDVLSICLEFRPVRFLAKLKYIYRFLSGYEIDYHSVLVKRSEILKDIKEVK